MENLTPEQEQEKALQLELQYQNANKVMNDLGYNYLQEAIADLVVEGFYNKEENTWTEITDPTDIQTNRNHMNLAQAKYYGVTIIRAGDEQPE